LGDDHRQEAKPSVSSGPPSALASSPGPRSSPSAALSSARVRPPAPAASSFNAASSPPGEAIAVFVGCCCAIIRQARKPRFSAAALGGGDTIHTARIARAAIDRAGFKCRSSLIYFVTNHVDGIDRDPVGAGASRSLIAVALNLGSRTT